MDIVISGNLPVLAKNQDIKSFVATMQALDQRPGPRVRITEVKLAGKEGKWYANIFNDTSRKYEDQLFQDFTDSSFIVIPIMCTSFCKWKYAKNAREMFITNEFIDTKNNPIDLFKITYGTESTKAKRELVKSYDNYQEFKAKHVKTDEISNKSISPYDFFTCMYAMHIATGKLIRIEMRGSSKKAWFKFKDASSTSVMCDKKIRLGVEKGLMPKEEGKEQEYYYYVSPSLAGEASEEEIQMVCQTAEELIAFMSYKQGKTIEASVEEESDDEHVVETAIVRPLGAPQSPDKPTPSTQASDAPMPMIEMIKANHVERSNEEPEIRLEDIPF